MDSVDDKKEKTYLCPLCRKELTWGVGDNGDTLDCECGFRYDPFTDANFAQLLKTPFIDSGVSITIDFGKEVVRTYGLHLGIAKELEHGGDVTCRFCHPAFGEKLIAEIVKDKT